MTTTRDITNPEAELARELTVKVIQNLLPNTCPGCGGRYGYALNDKEVCDTCFLMEAHQRLLYSMQPDEDVKLFAYWLLEHYTEDLNDYG